jgi:acetyltransferase-like isoleucine patch superfamily enzyme
MRLAKLKRWLVQRIAAAPVRSVPGAEACVLGPRASLLPEAEINNYSGPPDMISVGPNSHVRGRLLTYGHGGRIAIGEWCYIGIRTEIWSMESITIGDRVLIAHNVNIHDGSAHSSNAVERHLHYRHILEKGHPQRVEDLPGVESAPVVIEDDVWISFGVSILRGVRIGRGSVIAACSIVTRDVPPFSQYRNEIVPIVSPLKEAGGAAAIAAMTKNPRG